MEESAQQAEQPTSTWSPALKTLRFLKDHRDGFLAVGALVYALGFLTWAIHSLRTGVGFIGLFKAQYIVAGIVPSIFVYATLGYIAMRDRYSTSKPYWRGFTVVFCLVLAIERVFSAVIGVLFHYGIETEDQNVFQFPVDLLSTLRIFWYIFNLFLSSDIFLYIFYLILSVNILHWLWGSAQYMESPRVPRYFPLRISRHFPVGVALGVVIVFLLLSTMVYVLKVFPRLPRK